MFVCFSLPLLVVGEKMIAVNRIVNRILSAACSHSCFLPQTPNNLCRLFRLCPTNSLSCLTPPPISHQYHNLKLREELVRTKAELMGVLKKKNEFRKDAERAARRQQQAARRNSGHGAGALQVTTS